MNQPKKKKPPHDAPERGDACHLRADFLVHGTLTKYDPETEWATVEWLSDKKGPKVVHRYELKRIHGQSQGEK